MISAGAKKTLRARMRSLRGSVGNVCAERVSLEICRRLKSLSLPSPVAVYLAADGEIDIGDFIRGALRSGARVAAPRWNGREYELAELEDLSPSRLCRGPHGIPEPPPSAAKVKPSAVASWIIPGLAFTPGGKRLGYGGGWYDRFLSRADPRARKIAVAYPFQLLPDLPSEQHDKTVCEVLCPQSVIDVHSHDFPSFLARRAVDSLCRKTEGFLWPQADGTMENHLDHMEAAGVDMAVLCQVSTRPGQSAAFLECARAIMDGELGERARRMIIPFGSVHPSDPEALGYLGAFAAAGIKGVKLHPYYQSFSLADHRVWPLFRRIADLGLVVECHAGDDLGYPGSTGVAGPAEIAVLLRNVPGLKFIAAHLGGCEGSAPHATDEILELGCYIDTSALHKDHHKDEQMRLLRSWPRDRILFATDFPWNHYPESIGWVKSVRDREDWEAVFAGNARRLIGI